MRSIATYLAPAGSVAAWGCFVLEEGTGCTGPPGLTEPDTLGAALGLPLGLDDRVDVGVAVSETLLPALLVVVLLAHAARVEASPIVAASAVATALPLSRLWIILHRLHLAAARLSSPL
jgi:hypothetical protein